MNFDDACDFLTGHLLRKPGTRAAVLVNLWRDHEDYLRRLTDYGIEGLMYGTSARRIRYQNGSLIDFYTASEPDRIRGHQFELGIDATAGAGRDARHVLEYAVRLGEGRVIRVY
jgi:hypothetical protein